MTELDVINDALATLGEVPLNEVDEDHPFVAGIRRTFRAENQKVQAISWWFNLEKITLFPDAVSKFIYVPMDAIRCDPIKKQPDMMTVQRGRRLYDTDRNTYEFDRSVECLLVREVPFEDLPPSAQVVISLATARKFQQSYDADGLKANQIEMDYRESMARLKAEHTRNTKSNFLSNPITMRELNRIGGGIMRRGY